MYVGNSFCRFLAKYVDNLVELIVVTLRVTIFALFHYRRKGTLFLVRFPCARMTVVVVVDDVDMIDVTAKVDVTDEIDMMGLFGIGRRRCPLLSMIY